MNKLSNISPFLLLLIPVFVMMVLAFANSSQHNTESEVIVKTESSSPSFTKIATTNIK